MATAGSPTCWLPPPHSDRSFFQPTLANSNNQKLRPVERPLHAPSRVQNMATVPNPPRIPAISTSAISWSGRPFLGLGEAAGREACGNGNVVSGREWIWQEWLWREWLLRVRHLVGGDDMVNVLHRSFHNRELRQGFATNWDKCSYLEVNPSCYRLFRTLASWLDIGLVRSIPIKVRCVAQDHNRLRSTKWRLLVYSISLRKYNSKSPNLWRHTRR